MDHVKRNIRCLDEVIHFLPTHTTNLFSVRHSPKMKKPIYIMIQIRVSSSGCRFLKCHAEHNAWLKKLHNIPSHFYLQYQSNTISHSKKSRCQGEFKALQQYQYKEWNGCICWQRILWWWHLNPQRWWHQTNQKLYEECAKQITQVSIIPNILDGSGLWSYHSIISECLFKPWFWVHYWGIW